jgi:hypothetical protein
LAAVFVEAALGSAEASEALRELARWVGGAGPSDSLRSLRTADGAAVFGDRGLATRFEAAGAYVRHRAPRFAAARDQLAADGEIGDAMACARAAWNTGLYFEVHEVLEPLWLDEPDGDRKDRLRSLIAAGAGMHHFANGNTVGAVSLLYSAGHGLTHAGRETELDLERFARELLALAEAIERGRLRELGDAAEIPRLERRREHGA